MGPMLQPTQETPRTQASRVRVSVVIKALNEERHIGAAIVSALAAIRPIDGEVILADSGSTDGTVQIARQYPIAVVQLKNPAEKRCGIGPQLGYQKARGEFVYILDGDMELDPEFLVKALAAMDADPRLGGVEGWSRNKATRVTSSAAGNGARSSALPVPANGSTWAGSIARMRCAKWDIFRIATCTVSKRWTWGCGFAPPAGNCVVSQRRP